MIARPIDILLIQDQPGEVRLTVEALKECRIVNRLSVVESAVEALAFLGREGNHRQAPRPQLVLLDSDLKGGADLLLHIKRDPDLRLIPVAALHSTDAAESHRSAVAGAAPDCTVAKPLDFEKLVTILSSLQNFWLDIVELPTR